MGSLCSIRRISSAVALFWLRNKLSNQAWNCPWFISAVGSSVEISLLRLSLPRFRLARRNLWCSRRLVLGDNWLSVVVEVNGINAG
mmetsp:Transcript_7648/g.8673  ORF Transcript_7648/g.8673 Transcript_7648/m.8673 type:complete len:86 (+) Transcript_7648:165-422(+)